MKTPVNPGSVETETTSDDPPPQVEVSSAPAADEKLYGKVTKSWTSGGAAYTGAQKAIIIATYPVVKDPSSGAVDFVGTTFELEFTDVDNETSSVIPSYAFAFTERTQIPQPDDGGQFDLVGTVEIIARSSGRLLCVAFDMSGGSPADSSSTPKDNGPIFALDIPSDTVFTAKDPISTV